MALMLPPGIHLNIPAAAYHADPCGVPSLSSGIARTLLAASPMHAWHRHPRLNPQHTDGGSSDTMDAGTILHKILLGRGGDIEVIDAADYKANAARAARDAARADGKTPILAHKLDGLHECAKAARQQIEAHPDARHLFEPGDAEAVLIWNEPGITCRAMVDFLPHAPTMPMLDLKTTKMSAAPESWQRSLISTYCIQDEFYNSGNAILARPRPPMRFIVIEQDAPYGVSVLCADPSLSAVAAQKVERAKAIWRQCMHSGDWPGYPLHTAHVAAPAWMLSAMEDEQFMEAAE